MENPKLELLTVFMTVDDEGDVVPVLEFNLELMEDIKLTPEELEAKLNSALIQPALVNIIKPFMEKMKDLKKESEG